MEREIFSEVLFLRQNLPFSAENIVFYFQTVIIFITGKGGMIQANMTIMICDDDEKFYMKLKNILCSDKRLSNPEFIYCRDGITALKEYKDKKPDLIFMDIELGKDLGFDVVRELLLQGYQPRVVYITAYSHYVFDSFVGQPLGFVRKDKLETDLEIALLEVCRVFERKLKKLVIQSGVSEYELPLCRISVIEIFGHDMIIHYSDRSTLTVRYTLSKIEKQLAAYDFVRVSRNTLINLEHVKNISGKRVVMKNGMIIYVTSKKIYDVKEAVKNYICE